MSAWIQQSSPRPGDQWRPIPLDKLEKVPYESEGLGVPDKIASELEKLKRGVMDNAKPRIRDEEVRKAEKLIEDPLAYYVPYHSPRMGIYFRVNRMLSDFSNFISRWYGFMVNIKVQDIWRVYVMTIFWHEMAHHVIEDVTSVMEYLGKLKYPPLPRHIEEGFCEFNAFSTIEKRLSGPRWCRVPFTFINVPSKTRSKTRIPINTRKRILSCLYYHWGRNTHSSIYKPVVDPIVPKVVDGLWNGFWCAHLGGYDVIKAPDEIYRHLYCTTL